MPPLASDILSDTQESHRLQNILVRQSPKRAGRFHRLRLLLDLCELASGRDNPRLLSRRIELLEVGDDIVNLLWIL